MEIVQLAKIIPLHGVRDAAKLAALTEDMEENGWQGAPLVTIQYCDGYQALTGSHRYAAACDADLYEIPVEHIPYEVLTPEQWEDLEREHDTEGYLRALEEYTEEGTTGLDAAIALLQAEVDKERY